MAQQDVYRSTWVFSHGAIDDTMVTTLDYRLSTVADPVSEQVFCQQLADGIRDFVNTNYMPLVPASIKCNKIEVFNLSSNLVGCEALSGEIGSSTGDAVPLRNAPVIAKKTALRGKSFRGRMFMMAPSEAQQNSGALTPAYILALQTFIDSLKLVGSIGGNQYLATVYSETLTLDNVIENFQVRDIMGTQKSRQKVK